MGAAVGPANPALGFPQCLFESGHDFDFFQAVRLIEWLHPRRQLVVGLGRPPDEAIRFHAQRSLDFPASAVHRIAYDGAVVTITVAFLGLTGPEGALPEHYTEYLIWRAYERDSAAEAFLALFNHRFTALFYKAWLKHHFPVQLELDRRRDGQERFTHYLLDLIGMGTGGLDGRLEVNNRDLLPYSGLIAQYPHSAAALEGMLRDYFGVPVEIVQFQGRWVELESENLPYLRTEDLCNQLGLGAVAGDAVWNQRAAFRIRLGPLTYERFQHFLPSGSAIPALVSLTRFFAGLTLAFDLELVLRAEEVPCCELAAEAPQLGWTSWLTNRPHPRDACDLVLINVGDGMY